MRGALSSSSSSGERPTRSGRLSTAMRVRRNRAATSRRRVRMTEVKMRFVRQTQAQAAELRQLLDAPKLSAWDRGRMMALATCAPEQQHQEALAKLEKARLKREAKRAAGQQGGAKKDDDDGFVSIVDSWR